MMENKVFITLAEAGKEDFIPVAAKLMKEAEDEPVAAVGIFMFAVLVDTLLEKGVLTSVEVSNMQAKIEVIMQGVSREGEGEG